LSKYLIAIEPEFLPQYDELPKDIKKKFKKQISLLKENPKHPSLKIHKIEGSEFWEFYVDAFYRCVFQQEGNIYKLYFVGTHKLIDRFK
jgi:mRNA-degrading endonuclease RelE of RelBE toxin-antitoxin system